jgi:hypothetical protein
MTDLDQLDLFAAKALEGILAGNRVNALGSREETRRIHAAIAQAAYGLAEAMLEERAVRKARNWSAGETGSES